MSMPAAAHLELRSGTRAAHHALDHHPLLQRLVLPGLGMEAYAESLQAIHAAHAGLEARVLESAWHARLSLALGPRSHLLAQDLADLGRPVPEPNRHFSPPRSESEWLGQAYVLEGSRLGSAVIVKQVRAALGESVPARFLADKQASDAWPRILACIDRQLATPERVQAAVASARSVFLAYQRALDAVTES